MSDIDGSSSTDQLLPPGHRVQSKRRSSSKTRRKRTPFGAQSAIAEDDGVDSTDHYDEDDMAGSDTDRNWDASLAGSPEASASTEMPELPPILASMTEPLVLASVVSVSVLPAVEPFRRANPRATDTHRRPNPWEHANRKTFKPIITIGSQLPLGQPALRRPPRANFALSFIQQRKLERQGSRPERIAPSSLYAVSDTTLDAHRCGTLCVGAALDVREVYTYYMSLGVQCTAYKDGLNVVVHCLHVNDDEDSDSHAFYFMYGSMVLWNFDARGEHRLIAESRKLFSRGTLSDPEVDDFGFVYVSAADAKPHIHKDVIHLTTSDVMEKLAVSFGLAQSAKLSVFERTTESTIADTRHIPEQLANSGKISLSRCAGRERDRERRASVWPLAFCVSHSPPCAPARE